MATVAFDLKERLALGQQRRKQVPRIEHAAWDVKARKEDPLKLLAASMKGRVPDLVDLKYELMAGSPFGYFRGAVPVMAYDLSLIGNTGIISQLCGDAHVRNLGAFAAPDGRLVFDVNDYDETIAGPFEWDVKRMAASLVLAGRGASIKEAACRETVAVFAERYRTTIAEFARMPVLEVARYQVHRLRAVSPVEGILRMAERATPMHTLLSLTEPVGGTSKADGKKKSKGKASTKGAADKEAKAADAAAAQAGAQGGRIFKTIHPTLTRVSAETAQKVLGSLVLYERSLQKERRHFLAQYRPIDVAFKVVGTGSVGLRDYVIYMEGNGPGDPLFLQVKEEVESGWAPYIGKVPEAPKPRGKQHEGRRVVDGERAMQLQSDPFLGWTTLEGRDYLVRQLNDHKASIQLESLKAGAAMEYAAVCGEILARGHARSGDSCVLSGYLGNSVRFDDAVVEFAEAYANQTEKDWAELVRSMRKTGENAGVKAGAPKAQTLKAGAKSKTPKTAGAKKAIK